MPLVRRFGSKLGIYIYAAPSEHPPPHFHIVGPDTDVMVEIATLRIVAGRYRAKDIGEALAWAAENLGHLRQRWEELNERD